MGFAKVPATPICRSEQPAYWDNALQTHKQAAALREAFAELKLQPFTVESVKQYRKAVRLGANGSVSAFKGYLIKGLANVCCTDSYWHLDPRFWVGLFPGR